jgi:hypothetical protein
VRSTRPHAFEKKFVTEIKLRVTGNLSIHERGRVRLCSRTSARGSPAEKIR